jgi:hypothetical protein
MIARVGDPADFPGAFAYRHPADAAECRTALMSAVGCRARGRCGAAELGPR